MSEITADDYRAIADTTHDLHTRIHNLMGRVADGAGDPAWHELYELMMLAGVIAGAADRYARRAELPREPVDYRPGPVQVCRTSAADYRQAEQDVPW